MIRTTAVALLCAISLSGCLGMGQHLDTTAAPPPKPILPTVSEWVLQDCRDPVVPRAGAMTQQTNENLWGADDDSLKDCKTRHHILVNIVRAERSGLSK